MAAELPPEIMAFEAEVQQIFKDLNEGFQRLDKIKDLEKQRKQLEELTGKMRGVKRILKDFDQGIKDDPTNLELNKTVAEKKKSLIRELNTYIALRKTFSSTISSKAELFEGGSQAGTATNQAYRVASTMSNQELLQVGRKQMDEMDKSIERSKRVVEDTLHIGTETAVTLKAQTEQLGRIVNELDTIQFSIKKAAQLVREVGKQMATDKCIMGFLFLIVGGVVAVIVVKIVQGQKKKNSSPATTPVGARRMLSLLLDMGQ
ncbi:novel plant SNARE 13 isoform X1 [Physcomitrium patens]|uniref:novel plant SNARE 13 isoform X1 n=1 Tax=Physcomitrium patens TaxID=3218 RepID=UPI000D1798DB|nr:novel plant SNARE 13-like [Physcomitrium patens]|eukprot:XP_024387750.1 novel plant SNARE 13-like [Physcomitrella patens]